MQTIKAVSTPATKGAKQDGIIKPAKNHSPSADVGKTTATPTAQKCPECGISMRAEALSRHRRRKHTVYIDNVARELGVQSKLILAYLTERGHTLSPAYTLDPDVAAEVRAHFHNLTGLKTLTKPGHIRPRPSLNSRTVPVERLSFELLPPGAWKFDHVIAHFRSDGKHNHGSGVLPLSLRNLCS